MGICMDINPYKFEAEWGAYEFATHCVSKGTGLVVLSMAWLTRLEPAELVGEEVKNRPDMETLAYWIERFRPVVEAERASGLEVIVVLANRCGLEPGSVAGVSRGVDEEGEEVIGYAGSSCVLNIKDGQVKLYDILGRAEESVLVVDTDQVNLSG